MGNILIKNNLRFSNKPESGTRIDFGHQLSYGLIGCWLINESGGSKIFNLARKTDDIVNGAAALTKFGFYGSGSTGKIASNSLSDGLNRSYVVRSYRKGDGGSNFGRIFDYNATSHLFYNDSTNLTYSYGQHYSGGTVYFRYPRPAANLWVNSCVLYNGINKSARVFENGIEKTVTPSAAPFGAEDALGTILTIGNRKDGTRGWDGYIGFLYIYNRLLTSVEAISITTEPYQFFHKPKQRILYKISESAQIDISVNATKITASIKIDNVTFSNQKNCSVSVPLISGKIIVGSATVSITGEINVSVNATTISAKVSVGAVALLNQKSTIVSAATSSLRISVGAATFSNSKNASISVNRISQYFTVQQPTISTEKISIISAITARGTFRVLSVTVTTVTPSASGIGDIILGASAIEKTVIKNSRVEKTVLAPSRIDKNLLLESEI